jgi:hypothetical protein
VRQQQAGARRALVRYFAAFEEGSLSPPDCQERIGMLQTRIEASLIAARSRSWSRGTRVRNDFVYLLIPPVNDPL